MNKVILMGRLTRDKSSKGGIVNVTGYTPVNLYHYKSTEVRG